MLIHDLLIHSYSLTGSIWTAFTDLGLDVMTSRDHLILQVVISYRCSIANQVCISSRCRDNEQIKTNLLDTSVCMFQFVLFIFCFWLRVQNYADSQLFSPR